MKKLFILCLLGLSNLAMAATSSQLTHVGFSKSGTYYAFMESGVQDGSAFPFATVMVLDVVSNKYIGKPISVLVENEQTSQKTVVSKALKSAEAVFKKYGITQDNKGFVAVSRKETDLDTRELTSATFSLSTLNTGLVFNTFKISIDKTDANAPAALCPDPSILKKLKVELTDVEKNTVTALQDDKSLPSSRGCVSDYQIEDVVVYKPANFVESIKVVVLLRTYTPGFEGSDVSYMAVSGVLAEIKN